MTINNADYLQVIYPRKVIDFLADAKETLPEGSSIVCFARKPKPEYIMVIDIKSIVIIKFVLNWERL